MHYCHCGCGTVIRGYGYRCPRGTVWNRSALQNQFGYVPVMDEVAAVAEEVEAAQDFARGDFAAGMMREQAAMDYASGDTLGGMMDDALADFFE